MRIAFDTKFAPKKLKLQLEAMENSRTMIEESPTQIHCESGSYVFMFGPDITGHLFNNK